MIQICKYNSLRHLLYPLAGAHCVYVHVCVCVSRPLPVTAAPLPSGSTPGTPTTSLHALQTSTRTAVKVVLHNGLHCKHMHTFSFSEFALQTHMCPSFPAVMTWQFQHTQSVLETGKTRTSWLLLQLTIPNAWCYATSSNFTVFTTDGFFTKKNCPLEQSSCLSPSDLKKRWSSKTGQWWTSVSKIASCPQISEDISTTRWQMLHSIFSNRCQIFQPPNIWAKAASSASFYKLNYPAILSWHGGKKLADPEGTCGWQGAPSDPLQPSWHQPPTSADHSQAGTADDITSPFHTSTCKAFPSEITSNTLARQTQFLFFLRRDRLELEEEVVPPQDCEAPACCEGNCQPGCPAPSGDMDALLNKRLMKSSRSASLKHQTTNQPQSNGGSTSHSDAWPPYCYHTHTHTRMHPHTHTHTHTNSLSLTHSLFHTKTLSYMHKLFHTHTLSLLHTNSFSHAQTLSHTHSLFYMQTLSHMHKLSLSHTSSFSPTHKLCLSPPPPPHTTKIPTLP